MLSCHENSLAPLWGVGEKQGVVHHHSASSPTKPQQIQGLLTKNKKIIQISNSMKSTLLFRQDGGTGLLNGILQKCHNNTTKLGRDFPAIG